MTLELDSFTSTILKRNFFKIIDIDFFIDNFDTLIENHTSGTIFSLQLNSLKKEVPIIHSKLLTMRFSMVGTLFTYHLYINNDFTLFPLNTNIRIAKISDNNRLKEIAYNNFFDDKFHQDTLIPIHLANEYFSTWIENSIKGLTDIVWVYEENNELMGFLSLNYPKVNNNFCQIILNAIDKPYTRNGRYTELLKYAISHCVKKGFKVFKIGTYENSIGVHKTLNNLNFTTSNFTFNYHFHKR
jgi:hypothetical protein